MLDWSISDCSSYHEEHRSCQSCAPLQLTVLQVSALSKDMRWLVKLAPACATVVQGAPGIKPYS